MADRWFYAHGNSKSGPCSSRQLKDLAASGGILPTDTVWKEGVEKGALARKVKNLFASALADIGPVVVLPTKVFPVLQPPVPPALPQILLPAAQPAPQLRLPDTESELVPLDLTRTAVPESPPPAEAAGSEKALLAGTTERGSPKGQSTNGHQDHVRKGRAVVVRGAMIVAQDGVNVKFRKKCTKCGHTDSSWATLPIRNGAIRVAYFCPKCRKNREVELKGSLN